MKNGNLFPLFLIYFDLCAFLAPTRKASFAVVSAVQAVTYTGPPMTGFNTHTLLVFGAQTYLGQEVARFGRALGHKIFALVEGTTIPEPVHPWMHGVQWVGESFSSIQVFEAQEPLAIIYCDTTLHRGSRDRSFRRVLSERPAELIVAASQTRREALPRFVLRSTIDQPLLPSAFTIQSRQAEEILLNSPLPSAIFRLPLLYGPDRPDSVFAMALTRLFPPLAALRVETAALAMLRAALDPHISGILHPDEIARIGDVMIAQ